LAASRIDGRQGTSSDWKPHRHPHPDRNHDRGLNRTLQCLRVSTAARTLLFARDVCNLLTLCIARADTGSSCRMPESSLDAGMVTWRASALTRSSTFSINARDLALYSVMEDAKVLANGSCLEGGVSGASPSRLSKRQNDSSSHPTCRAYFQFGRIGPPTANLVDLQPEVLKLQLFVRI
jgi:hypothetical protein